MENTPFATTSPHVYLRLRHSAFCSDGWPKDPKVALGPARANVAYPPAIPRPHVPPGSRPPSGPAGTGPRLTTVFVLLVRFVRNARVRD